MRSLELTEDPLRVATSQQRRSPCSSISIPQVDGRRSMAKPVKGQGPRRDACVSQNRLSITQETNLLLLSASMLWFLIKLFFVKQSKCAMSVHPPCQCEGSETRAKAPSALSRNACALGRWCRVFFWLDRRSEWPRERLLYCTVVLSLPLKTPIVFTPHRFRPPRTPTYTRSFFGLFWRIHGAMTMVFAMTTQASEMGDLHLELVDSGEGVVEDVR